MPKKDVVTFEDAPAVRAIAQELIPKYHGHLQNVRIDYIFRSKHASSGGKLVMGRARKITGLNAFLAKRDTLVTVVADKLELPQFEDFFVIEIAHDVWIGLKDAQKEALVDHELSHCYVDLDEGKLVVLPHDLEEFAHIVKRHGLWQHDVEHFFRHSGQLQLKGVKAS